MSVLSRIQSFCLPWLLLGSCFAGNEPLKIEPPSWWLGHSVNPVRLLLTGEDLAGMQIAPGPGISVSNVIFSHSGKHALCDLHISPAALPGNRQLRLQKPGRTLAGSFSVLPPLIKSGGFAGFSPEDVIYLIMPDRFSNGCEKNDNPEVSPCLLNRSKPRDYHGGDLQGIIDRLPYLADSGVTAIWLTPWYDNINHFNTRETYTRDNQRSGHGIASTDYHGYGAVDFYAVEERLGDMETLRKLVRAAHARGIKVIQDQVANHTGPYHSWVKNPPTPSWFNGTEEQHLDNNWEIWTTVHSNAPAARLKCTIEGWFINILPDLNQNDPETAAYLIQNSLWWIGMTGIDAVRQDTLSYVPRKYWSQWTTALKREFPQVTILGEVLNGQPELVAFFQGGRKRFDGIDSGIDTLFDFPLHYAMRDVFARGQPMTRLAQALAADSLYVDPSALVTFLGLHDTGRFANESGITLDRLKLAFTFLLTGRGTPMIYYGDEIGMKGGGDPDNRRDFPGGWKEDTRSAFEASGRTPAEAEVHGHIKRLTALRRDVEPLRTGTLATLYANDKTLAFIRTSPVGAAIAAFNNGPNAQTLKLALTGPLASETRLFDRLSDGAPISVRDGALEFVLQPYSAAILTPEVTIVASDGGDISGGK
jgi:glycosidase